MTPAPLLRVYIGHDQREQVAFDVARRSAERWLCQVVPIYASHLRAAGLLTRPLDTRGAMWDLHSGAPQSTEFAITRFFVPLLAHSGWCLFVDSDVVFLQDPHQLLKFASDEFAAVVVKHPPMGTEGIKMDGQVQTSYPRKLWSSVVLWNADHAANKRLNLSMLNQWPGRDLHAFGWLADSEIGSLPPEANWLVGLQPKPAHPIIAHYTLGTPNMPGYEHSEHADLWRAEAARQ